MFCAREVWCTIAVLKSVYSSDEGLTLETSRSHEARYQEKRPNTRFGCFLSIILWELSRLNLSEIRVRSITLEEILLATLETSKGPRPCYLLSNGPLACYSTLSLVFKIIIYCK